MSAINLKYPMLSICIPIYNHDVSKLAKSLQKQADQLDIDAELLLLDDASAPAYQKRNRELNQITGIQYEELDKNVGRSRIRNILSDKASGSHILFMDCDTLVTHDDYLAMYAREIPKAQVVCGGHVYDDKPADPKYLLHWTVGSSREVRSALGRQKRPYHSFMTGNFMIARKVMQKIRFREDLQGYGHEDTMFGYELKKHHIPVKHIENPLLHTGLEDADSFLKKSRESIINLMKSWEMTGHDMAYAQMVTILENYLRYKHYKLFWPLKLAAPRIRMVTEKNLRGESPKMWVFDLYKLCHLHWYETK